MLRLLDPPEPKLFGPWSVPGPIEAGSPGVYELFSPKLFNPELKEELKVGLLFGFKEFPFVVALPFPKSVKIETLKN